MDPLAWNTFLRASPEQLQQHDMNIKDKCRIHISGLIALNLKGNFITSAGLALLSEAVCRNSWLLGRA